MGLSRGRRARWRPEPSRWCSAAPAEAASEEEQQRRRRQRRGGSHDRCGGKLGDCFFDSESGGLREEHCCGKNEFKIMGVPESLEVDLRALDANKRFLQQRLHPDLFAQAPERQRRRAERYSARVNQAYATVRDPILRADRAISFKLGRTVLGDDDKDHVDFELLAEILETREAIEATLSEDELRGLFDQNDAAIWDVRRAMIDSYAAGDFERAAKCLVRLQYYTKIRHDILDTSEKRGGSLQYQAVAII